MFTDQHLAVLTAIRLYGVTFFEVARRSCGSEDATRSVLRRLSPEFLRAFPLFGGRKIYRPTAALCARFGLPRKMARPLQKQALAMKFAQVHFAYFSGLTLRYLAMPVFNENFPDLALASRRGGYFLGPYDGRDRLFHCLVDFQADPTRIAKKCFLLLKRRSHVQEWRALISDQTFVPAIITPTKEKGNQIQAAAARRHLPVKLFIHVCPELIHLI